MSLLVLLSGMRKLSAYSEYLDGYINMMTWVTWRNYLPSTSTWIYTWTWLPRCLDTLAQIIFFYLFRHSLSIEIKITHIYESGRKAQISWFVPIFATHPECNKWDQYGTMPFGSSSATIGFALRRNMDSKTSPKLQLLEFLMSLYSKSFLTLLKRCTIFILCSNRDSSILLLVSGLISLESRIAMRRKLTF